MRDRHGAREPPGTKTADQPRMPVDTAHRSEGQRRDIAIDADGRATGASVGPVRGWHPVRACSRGEVRVGFHRGAQSRSARIALLPAPCQAMRTKRSRIGAPPAIIWQNIEKLKKRRGTTLCPMLRYPHRVEATAGYPAPAAHACKRERAQTPEAGQAKADRPDATRWIVAQQAICTAKPPSRYRLNAPHAAGHRPARHARCQSCGQRHGDDTGRIAQRRTQSTSVAGMPSPCA